MFSDALDREAEWLSVVGDGLPALTGTQDAPFEIVQARQPRLQAMSKRAIYVLRAPSPSARLTRFAAQRSMLTTHLMLRLHWPFRDGRGSAEAEQVAFEQAIDMVLVRVQGLFSDKTHGGRFLSVAENPDDINIDYTDPMEGVQAFRFLAHMTYSADDTDFNN
jgi:hypothetical protein